MTDRFRRMNCVRILIVVLQEYWYCITKNVNIFFVLRICSYGVSRINNQQIS